MFTNKAEERESLPEVTDGGRESLVMERTLGAPSFDQLGRYRVVREIAAGGMATVNLAVIDGLDKLVALKVIHPHLATEESFVHMFLDEARIASSISHRNVCSVFDYGEQDGRYFMAMDFLAGKTFRDVIRQLRVRRTAEDPLKVTTYCAHVIAQSCEGLHAAHELRDGQGELMNVVHRDVSPHNLFVTYDGSVSVVDFGIARASDRLQQTATGILKGKFSYMAPEQVRQAELDRRVDVWALGVCLWEALTQKRMFVRASQAETLMSVMMDPIAAPSTVMPGIHPELDRIVLRAVNRDLDQRYATAREMGRDLVAFCRSSGVSVGQVEVEQWIREMFPNDHKQSSELMRRAKRAASLGVDWHDATHSGAPPRSGTNSGMVFRAPNVPSYTTGGRTESGVAVSANGGAQAGSDRPQQSGKLKTAVIAAACTVLGVLGAYALLSGEPQDTEPTSQVEPDAPVAAAEPVGAQVAAEPVLAEGEQAELAIADTTPTEETAEVEEAVQEVEEEVEEEAEETASAGRAAPRRVVRRVMPRPRRNTASPTDRAKASSDDDAKKTAAASEVAEGSQRRETEESAPQEAKAHASPAAAAPTPEPPPVTKKPQPAKPEAAPAVTASKPAPKPQKPAEPKRPLAARISYDGVDISGSLGTSTVLRILGRAEPLIEKCYRSSATKAGRNDFAAVAVQFTVDEAGSVRRVNASSHSLPSLSSCVSQSLNRQRSDRRPDVGAAKISAKVRFSPL